MEKPSTGEFAAAAGISVSYASEILNDVRQPSETLALSIYKKTGLRFGPLKGLTDEQIGFLASIRQDAA